MDTLTLKGCVVTIDAMGSQTAITKEIRSQKGDYVIGLKRNQGKLYDEAINFFDQAIDFSIQETGCSYAKTIEKGGSKNGK